MDLFNWLFRKSTRPAPSGQKRYEYPTGNVELAMRVERGEFLMAVIADIQPRWTPGNEYLWDEYDPGVARRHAREGTIRGQRPALRPPDGVPGAACGWPRRSGPGSV
jgi:hypothetical protein